MGIYTRTGDTGRTSLYGGKRVSKNNPIVEACGTLDELSSYIGLIVSHLENQKDVEMLRAIQNDLYQIMAKLAGSKNRIDFIDDRLLVFEKQIDHLTRALPLLHDFILPGGSNTSALFHIARTVCRRAERRTVKLRPKKIISYLNRLSDLLFVFARTHSSNKEIKTKD